MRHGALFNGIGGFQLAAHWMGWENVWHCEIDKFCNKVVKQHFPKSICYEDIKQFDAREWNGKIDIISGGFPCQPFSQAGKRKGTADNRYLWPEMLRVIGEVQPRFIVGENVGGLVNWDRGMVFEQVQADLETTGYESAAFILPAAGVNAPHRRDRIWFVAHNTNSRAMSGNGAKQKVSGSEKSAFGSGICTEGIEIDTFGSGQIRPLQYGGIATIKHPDFGGVATNAQAQRKRPGPFEQGEDETSGEQLEGAEQRSDNYNNGTCGAYSNANDQGLQGSEINGSTGRIREVRNEQLAGFFRTTWKDFPTQSPVCGRNDGISDRVDRIKALGNAIVPQVAYEIFKAIESTPT